jgi:hypothetical protein
MARPTKRPMMNIAPELLASLPKMRGPGKLNTVADLQVEWARTHRAFWRRQISQDAYSATMYGLQTGTMITRTRDELAHAREELERLAGIERELAQIKGTQPRTEYLPAAYRDEPTHPVIANASDETKQ